MKSYEVVLDYLYSAVFTHWVVLPVRDRYHELAELPTLHDTLCVITRLTFKHDESKIGITAVGGVEAAVEVMKTFSKCSTNSLSFIIILQYRTIAQVRFLIFPLRPHNSTHG
jgi:hypothetical protein